MKCQAAGLVLIAVTVGCNKQQVADAILSAAFGPALVQSEAGEDLLAESERPVTPYDQLSRSLDELQRLQAQREPATDPAQIAALIDQVTTQADELDRSEEVRQLEKEQLCKVKLTVLGIGAELCPEQFAAQRDQFREAHFGRSVTKLQDAEDSVARILTEYLAVTPLDPAAAPALSLHAFVYPECRTNVRLYMTLVERLKNENQLVRAVEVAQEGLQRCEHLPDVSDLKRQLELLYARYPSLR